MEVETKQKQKAFKELELYRPGPDDNFYPGILDDMMKREIGWGDYGWDDLDDLEKEAAKATHDYILKEALALWNDDGFFKCSEVDTMIHCYFDGYLAALKKK